MDTKNPQDSQYHDYDPPNVVPISSRPSPVTSFLDALREAGLPESLIEQTRSTLSSLGLTDSSINDIRREIDRQTKRGVDWSRKNPQKAAGGFAVIVLAFGLLLLLMERKQ